MVSNKQQVIEKSVGSNSMKVHTFGIGDHCDLELVTKVAQSGRGSCSVIRDDKSHLVSGKIILALERAFEPSYNNCKLTIAHGGKEKVEVLGEVHRNELIYRSFFMPKDELASFRMEFTYHDEAGNAKTLYFDYG